MTPPRCEYEGCGCGHAKMQLNGLRWVCTQHCTLETHIDDYPIYFEAPKLLKLLREAALELTRLRHIHKQYEGKLGAPDPSVITKIERFLIKI